MNELGAGELNGFYRSTGLAVQTGICEEHSAARGGVFGHVEHDSAPVPLSAARQTNTAISGLRERESILEEGALAGWRPRQDRDSSHIQQYTWENIRS